MGVWIFIGARQKSFYGSLSVFSLANYEPSHTQIIINRRVDCCFSPGCGDGCEKHAQQEARPKPHFESSFFANSSYVCWTLLGALVFTRRRICCQLYLWIIFTREQIASKPKRPMKKGGWRWDQKDITFANLQFYFSTDSATLLEKWYTPERESSGNIKRTCGQTRMELLYENVALVTRYTQYIYKYLMVSSCTSAGSKWL